jgi:transposase
MRRPRLTERDRVRIISDRFDYHRSIADIARRQRCALSTVHKVCRDYKHHVDWQKQACHGRKPILDKKQQNHLFDIVRSNPSATSTEIARHLFNRYHININPRSVRRYRLMKFHPARELLVPTFKFEHYINRIDYCITHRSNNFHCVVFSDEKSFCLDHTANVSWIEEGAWVPTREISSAHTRVMVWGGIWYHGKTELAIVEGSINHKKYIEVLSEYLLPSMPTANQFVFQQDNAKPHTVPAVYSWMSDHAVRVLDPWPAYSPDFNPIEHVWSWMSQYVAKERPSNRQSLIEAINRSWNAIPQSVIQGYIDALPARLVAVHNNGGARLD